MADFLSPDEPCTSSAGPSLRKMILRQALPPSATPSREVYTPSIVSVVTPIEDMQMGDGETTSSDGISPALDVRKRKTNPWSLDEVSAFYEGVKIHGKDFDSVIKVMLKRKVEKTKEHVKTFFFNSVKTYKSMLNLTDDDLSLIPKDARELFIFVNACEWKRKTQNTKVNNEKLRELILEGTVNVKVGRKIVMIKTPPCPALCRYFSCRKAEKIPAEMHVHLEPTGNEDHVFMRNRNYNPFLRIKLNANDRIMKLLDFLARKWGAEEDSPISVTLWPDSSCEVASLTVSTVETSPFIALSLSKLKKHLEEAKEKMEPPKKLNSLQLAADANIKSKPTYNVYYPKPFSLTDAVIAEGITMQNINSAILAELFCVCGRKSPIQLRYQIKHDKPRVATREPWKIMIGLLNRGFGENLSAAGRREEEKDRRREQKVAELIGPSIRKRKMTDDYPGPYAFDSNSDPDLIVPPPISTERTGIVGSSIVQQENNAFENQLAMLRKTQRTRNAPAKRKCTNAPAILSTGTPPISIGPTGVNPTPPVVTSNEQKPFTVPTCTLIPRKTPGKSKYARNTIQQPGPSNLPTERQRMPTDFSSVVFSPAKKREKPMDVELQKKRTDEFLSSLRSPADTPIQTPRKLMMQQLFGDELSMSPGSTRHASMLDGGETGDGSMIDFTDLMYQKIKDNADASFSQPALHFSPNEVHQQYQDMMSSSQDSHDYVFQQFQKKKFTPKKRK